MKKRLFFTFLLLMFILGISNLIIAEDRISNETSAGNLTISTDPILIIKFFPKEVKLGDVQLNMQIQNNLNETLDNIAIFIFGRGFSTYEIIPAEKLGPGERDYIFINGNFRESGNIILRIKINNEVFYENISVIDVAPKSTDNPELIKKAILINLSLELDNLKKNYASLELELSGKKEDGYDISGIKLEELKKYIRETESGIIIEDINSAKANLKLAQEEYIYQKEKLDNAKIIPIIAKIKENALLISTIIGAILAFFALSEVLKRQTKNAAKTITPILRPLIKNRFKKKNKK